jgi:hypothetical protein
MTECCDSDCIWAVRLIEPVAIGAVTIGRGRSCETVEAREVQLRSGEGSKVHIATARGGYHACQQALRRSGPHSQCYWHADILRFRIGGAEMQRRSVHARLIDARAAPRDGHILCSRHRHGSR